MWARSDQRARRALQVHREWIARHELSSGEVTEVQRAITRGVVLEDARLRAAAVEEARTQLAVWGARGDVAQRVRLALAALWIGLGVLLIIESVASGDWSWHYLLLAANVSAVVAPQTLLRRNLRRAVALNSEPSTP